MSGRSTSRSAPFARQAHDDRAPDASWPHSIERQWWSRRGKPLRGMRAVVACRDSAVVDVANRAGHVIRAHDKEGWPSEQRLAPPSIAQNRAEVIALTRGL